MEAYERAWRTGGTGTLQDVFSEDVTYRAAPFAESIRGQAALESFWEAERDGPDEVFTMEWDPVAVEGPVAVVRVDVTYGDPPARVYRDLWIIMLAPDGRCGAFEEWPFFPGQPLSAGDAGAAGPAG